MPAKTTETTALSVEAVDHAATHVVCNQLLATCPSLVLSSTGRVKP